MKILGKLTIGFVALIAGVVVAYKVIYPTYSHRYRLTLAIEVDGQVHTGSSVIEVRFKRQPRFLPDVAEYAIGVHGQAALVDLGPHGVIVAALHPGTIENGPVRAAYLALIAYGMRGSDDYPKMAAQTGRRELPRMPLLIWFSDITDPNTARAITSADFPGLFGPSARLKEASVEITQEPVVIDLDKKLPWYKALAEQQKSRGVLGRPNHLQLVYSMFIGEGS